MGNTQHVVAAYSCEKSDQQSEVTCYLFLDIVMGHVQLLGRISDDYESISCELTNTSVIIQNLRTDIQRGRWDYLSLHNFNALRNWVFDSYDHSRSRKIDACVASLSMFLSAIGSEIEKENIIRDIRAKLSELEECYESVAGFIQTKTC